MSAVPPAPGDCAASSADAVRLLAQIHRLTVRACRSESAAALRFLMLNDTFSLLPYDRASLWRLDVSSPLLLGFSGQVEVNRATELAEAMQKAVAANRKVDRPQALSDEAWQGLAPSGCRAEVFWLPISAAGRIVAALCLERWQALWRSEEQYLLAVLAEGYSAAWEKFESRGIFRPRWWLESPAKRRRALLAAALIATAVCFFPMRLRVVAPCEIAPQRLAAIAAPFDGKIAAVAVEPGQRVRPGDVLFRYDPRLPLEQLKVAQQQVQIVESQLRRAQAKAVSDDDALAEIAMLAHRLEQERARLALAQERVAMIEVKAACEGEVVIDKPEEWAGKPVSVGERVLALAEPRQTKVRIWVAEADNVELAAEEAIKVSLNIAPEKTYAAQVRYLAPIVALSPGRVPSFLVEADWRGEAPALKVGLKGTAVLYGKRVPFIYWVLRKPLAWWRRVTGI